MMTSPNSIASRVSIAFACLVAASAIASAASPADQAATPEVTKYCANIAAAASDARLAWQTGKLNEVEVRIKARIQDLDAKEAELRAWIEKREAMAKQANEKLVGIYSKMRPETAATQISTLDDEMAATVLAQLTPGKASAIFNEIVPERAAKLAGLIVAGPERAPAEKASTEKASANDKAPAPDKKL